LDGSFVYGSHEEESDKLRDKGSAPEKDCGKLRMTSTDKVRRGLLPRELVDSVNKCSEDPPKLFVAGEKILNFLIKIFDK